MFCLLQSNPAPAIVYDFVGVTAGRLQISFLYKGHWDAANVWLFFQKIVIFTVLKLYWNIFWMFLHMKKALLITNYFIKKRLFIFLQWLHIQYIDWYFDANENLFPGYKGKRQERMKGTEEVSPVHTLFHR